MTSPETLELEAVDAALAGRAVSPEHAELAELALLLRDDRPQPAPAWTARLDRRVEAGFPAPARRRRAWLRTAAPIIALAAVFAPIVVLGALSGGGDDQGDVATSAGGGSSGASAGAEQAAPEPTLAAPPADALQRRKVERSATMMLGARARDIDRVAGQVGDVAADVGGYVARSNILSSGGGDLQLRVPSNRLDETIQRLSKLAKMRELSRSSQDITGAVVSARDRLRDARTERKSLLKQLAAATTVNQTESIRARLRDVSREIAHARNALRRVSNRANFANLYVTIGVERDSSGGGTWTPGDAFHDALRVLEVIAGVAVIAAAVALPLLVAWLLGWLARRGVTRRRRERALDIA